MSHILIIDTDPSIDDGIAILMALSRKDIFDHVIINTTAGNNTIQNVTINAFKILELVGANNVVVNQGSNSPLVNSLVLADHVYGKTGLDGFDLPEPRMSVSGQPAYQSIIDTVMMNPPDTVTLCCLAPLTNVAFAVKVCPAIVQRVKSIVIMGGAFFTSGNITSIAEFNVYVDPEAASIVFSTFPNIVCIPLDCTHNAMFDYNILEKFLLLKPPLGDALYQLLKEAKAYEYKKYNCVGFPLHDPTVIAYLINPEIFTGSHAMVTVDIRRGFTRGGTFADYNRYKETGNAFLLTNVNTNDYLDIILSSLGRF